MARRQEETPPVGAPAWMATFSDLMNLLLCFFVMLFSMSTMEESKLQALVSAMNNTPSIFDKGSTAIGEGMLVSNGVSQLNELDQYINSTGKTADSDTDGKDLNEFDKSPEALEQILQEERLKENEELAERIEEALYENEIGDQVEITATAQFVRLSMKGSLLFDSGSIQFKEGVEDTLYKVGMILERYAGHQIEIEGHTDNVPIHTAQYASNEELSSARALAVFYYLVNNSRLDPANMKHSGMGERAPVADNSTEEGRSRNRRVEIKIMNPAQN